MTLPRPSELLLRFDENDTWRESQVKAIDWLQSDSWLEKDDESETERMIRVLEAPTGSGKTGIILGLAALNPELRFLILCATKLEQEQYMRHILPGSKVRSVKGKNNFHCIVKHTELEEGEIECKEALCWLVHVDQAPCTAGFRCSVASTCLYFMQKNEAKNNAQAIPTNYAYGLSMLNYVGKDGLGEFDVIVEDEGHVLDLELERFIEIPLSRKIFERAFNFSLPNFRNGGSVAQWKDWIEDSDYLLKMTFSRYDEVRPEELSQDELRERNTIGRYKDFIDTIGDMKEEWVVEDDGKMVVFKPVWVTEDSWRVLFVHAKRHIIMSGTIPSATELGKKVGINAKEFEFFRLPYTFPPENRQIILRPRVELSRNSIDANLPDLVAEIDALLEENLGLKCLIHTKSYKISNYLEANSEFSHLFFTHDSRNRSEVLRQFKEAEAPAILVSPSFDKAVDLPGDECELIVISKIPFPYLGTKVMQKRAKRSRRYYLHETLMGVIQMAGRGVRREADVCPTYIFDAAAPKFFREARSLIPQAIKEAIVEAE